MKEGLGVEGKGRKVSGLEGEKKKEKKNGVEEVEEGKEVKERLEGVRVEVRGK